MADASEEEKADALDDPREARTRAAQIAGVWYLPSRRHHRPPALRAELEAAGFAVFYQDEEHGGHVICTRA